MTVFMSRGEYFRNGRHAGPTRFKRPSTFRFGSGTHPLPFITRRPSTGVTTNSLFENLSPTFLLGPFSEVAAVLVAEFRKVEPN